MIQGFSSSLISNRELIYETDLPSFQRDFASLKTLDHGYGPSINFERASGATYFNADGVLVGVDFSTSSNTIGTGSKTFTLDATAGVNRSWAVGSIVRVSQQGTPTNFMRGTVTSYNAATQVLVMDATTTGGSGTITSWRLGTEAARFDHDPATGASRGLLIEEARTNLLVRSEEFGTTWSAVNSASVTSNTSVAPSGATTAYTLTAAANNSYIQQAVTFTGDGSKAISLFIKAGTSTATEVQIRDTTANASRGLAAITWAAGVPSATVTGGSLLGLTSVGSGWYRLQVEAGSVVAANTNNFRIAPDTSGGNGNIIIWGAQAENGAFPTSYIPTTTAAATRSADSAVVTTISSFYNQAEGTLFAEWVSNVLPPSGSFPKVMEIGVVTGTQTDSSRIEVYSSSGNLGLGTYVVGSNVTSFSAFSSVSGTLAVGSTNRASLVYKADDFRAALNGALFGAADTSGSVPNAANATQLGIGRASNGTNTGHVTHIRKIAYWPKRLSNTLLQQLTT